jgi:hypothetical protein
MHEGGKRKVRASKRERKGEKIKLYNISIHLDASMYILGRRRLLARDSPF